MTEKIVKDEAAARLERAKTMTREQCQAEAEMWRTEIQQLEVREASERAIGAADRQTLDAKAAAVRQYEFWSEYAYGA